MSKIWDFFKRKEKTAICNCCKKDLSLGSIEKKKQTTINIKNHLQKSHPSEWEKFIELEKTSSSLKRKKVDDNNNVPNANQIQMTIPQTLAAENKWPDDHTLSLQTDKIIMDLMLVDMLPFNLVEGEAFKRIKFGNPLMPSKYRLKTEKFFRTSLMPQTYEKVKNKVIGLLDKSKWISCTTDIWSNPSKSCSLLGFTAHFINGSKRLKVVLGAAVLEEDHTGFVISEKLEQLINSFHIQDKIHLIITDNAYNMKAAMRIGSFSTFGCVAHTLQLVINDGVLKNLKVEKLIKKCRLVVAHFKRSEQAGRRLNKYQEMCNLPQHKLTQDVVTRWNSTYSMWERMLEQKEAIILYAAKYGSLNIPSGSEWELMNNLVPILKPFYEATLQVSYDSSSTSIVIPLIAMLRSKLQNNPSENDEIKCIRACLLKSLNTRFEKIMEPNLMIATCLDPRFKDKYFSLEECFNCKKEILKYLQEKSELLDPCVQNATSELEVNSHSSGLWDDHDHLMLTSNFNIAKPSNEEEEIQNYLKEPLLSRDKDIFQYWELSHFTNLKAMAVKYLSAPPSSVASEQLFSAAGQIYSDRRSNLLGENADKILFLTYNIRLFNFEY